MAELKQNYIAGSWVSGPFEVENRNPSDLSDVIGHFTQASRAQLNDAIAAAKEAQTTWAAYGLERKQAVG
ncbi:MAG: aldehyde dehydrogenase family protein, partial [Pseudomonadota bacterium]